MKKFNVLDPEIDIFRSCFLEASAGTGKTFAIENIVPRLLIESAPSIQLNEVLVVTFTRAATRELKSRIYSNLLKIVQVLEAHDEGPLYLAPIRKKGPEAIFAAKRNLRFSPCMASVQGFCKSLPFKPSF
jgi:exodeoxyribonuclease V beta subunit